MTAKKIKANEKRTERGALFLMLYKKAFPLVAAYISKMGGCVEQARDIFQDALLIYYEKTIAKPTLNLNYSEKAYLFGIAKHLWNKRYKENHLQAPVEPMLLPFLESGVDELPETEISSQKLLRLLSKAGEKCMALLSAFYYEKLDMNSLAERFGFSGARSAAAQKFKCLEKVKQTVKQKSLSYEDILD